MKDDKSENKMRFYKKSILRRLGSRTAFWIYSMAILVGFLIFIYASFKANIEQFNRNDANQAELLFEIRESQENDRRNAEKLEEVNEKLKILEDSNRELTVIVCTLQRQLKDANIVPEVEVEECTNIM